ncbi:MAG: hypothetical protein B7X58_05850 [Marinobacter sp. 34-60-7]|nr:MAG: hypothetical protein B7X58_05850 [Marinobacter sp. 34-60-7]
MTTTTADTVSDGHQPSAEQVRRGRRMALLLFAVGFGPMILATVMYFTGWLNPTGSTNEGELLNPIVSVASFNLETRTGEPLASRFEAGVADPQWLMLVVADTCAESCEQLLYLARQVNIALGKNAPKVARAAYISTVPADLESRWADEYQRMERLQLAPGTTPAWPAAINPAEASRILLVDPYGNVMMHYGDEHTGKQMLKDLKHLLKLSQIE